MKKLFLSCMAAVAALFVLIPSGAVSAASLNNFEITKYAIDFSLSRDAEQRSVLVTKESITADFPADNQNHGIERYIPKAYDKHPTGLAVTSVKDANGAAVQYKTYESGEYTVLRIGNPDTYVHGMQTYTIEYTQHDVTKYFADTKKTEFYWDANGTEWRVPIRELTVSLSIDESVRDKLTGDNACYMGSFGSRAACKVSSTRGTITAQGNNLGPGENITLAIGFLPDTFAIYQPSVLERIVNIWLVLQGILVAVAVAIIVWVSTRYSRWSKRTREVGTIIPEYLPPKNASVSLSATMLPYARSTFAAQLIDFAVRHYIKIYETKEKSFWSNAEYEIEIIKPITDLRAEEREFLTDLFNGTVTVGTKKTTKEIRKDYGLSSRMMDNPKKLQNLMRGDYALQYKVPEKSAWFKRTGTILLVLGLILLSPPLLIVAVIALIMAYTLWVRTDEGVTLYRYLLGLKLYISVAEQERLKMLQSPEGAEKAQVSDTAPKKLVKLYEKVLPYAMLFGQEKQWNKQLGTYYESTGTQPDWYTGTNMAAFNALAFSSAMSGLTTSINSTGAASSSSGGSSGGGSSGGGGGGGGGGGW